jgi:predicted transcriptional regulator
MTQTATTIYLDPEQRNKLFKLAASRKSSFSSEIRAAIDKHLEATESAFSEEEARLLLQQANHSIDRISKVIDEAHQTVRQILKTEQKKTRK